MYLAHLGLDALVQIWPRWCLYTFPLIALPLGVLESVGVMEAVGVAAEGAHLIASGLSTEIIETILQYRSPCMKTLYSLRWNLFTSWCSSCQVDPVNCPVGSVMEFLQERFSAGLASSTLKVYVADIDAYHAPLGDQSLRRNMLVSHFLHGVLRVSPMVLEALCGLPFEPSEEVLENFLTLKTVLATLPISSLKRFDDLQAHARYQQCSGLVFPTYLCQVLQPLLTPQSFCISCDRMISH